MNGAACSNVTSGTLLTGSVLMDILRAAVLVLVSTSATGAEFHI